MKLLSRINRMTKKSKLVISLVTTLVVLAGTAAVYAGFGPNRPTFDWNSNPGVCNLDANHGDRCGSVTPVFNSFINTPSYGDERNFTRIAPVVPGQKPTDASYSETNTATAGNEYWVRTLVHNDANQNLNCLPAHRDPATNDCTQIDAGSPGIATGTKVSLQIAQGVANGVDVMTKVSASNATPGTVWDTATLASANKAFAVAYVPGSAVLYNGVHKTGLALSDAITSANGVAIGYNQMDGNLPGCFDFSAYVYVKVKVNAPALKFDKLVRFAGEDSSKWRDALTAKKGDRVQYLLDYLDNGTATVNNIVLRDELPSNLALVPGSVKWIDINHPAPGTSVPDSFLFDKAGVLVGNYGVNGGGYIMFDATVKSEVSECVARNVGFVRGDNVPEQSNDAVVTIQDCNPIVPTYSCDSLSASKVTNKDRTYQFSGAYSVQNGAKFKSFTYNFGDGTTPLTTDKSKVEYTYATDGEYATQVTVNFSVNGVDKSATSNECKQVIKVETPIYTCDLLAINKIADRQYSFKVNYTAKNGATFKNITYNFGDGTTETVTSNPKNHTYAKDGIFVSVATVNFTVNGQTVSKSGASCTQTVTVTPVNCTVPGKENLPKDSPDCKADTTPPTPKELPNTGPSDIIGIFAATSIAGAMIHKFVLSRRYQ